MPSVVLLAHTAEPERIVARAGRLCYFKGGLTELERAMPAETVKKLVAQLLKSGHFSAFEHAGFTFGIEGISRACSHQLVRHRIASYSQQSQRYVTMGDNFEYIVPPEIAKNKRLSALYASAVRETKKIYDTLIEGGIPKEDARYVLPNAAETKIVVTMNARELLHFFSLRLCRRAQWEIRDMAKLMLREAKKTAPLLFGQAGPECVRTRCPEGAMCCGKANAVKKEMKNI